MRDYAAQVSSQQLSDPLAAARIGSERWEPHDRHDHPTPSSSPTPAEEDFPLIISVDDHILEPRDLWQRELPASLRDRGPRCVREKTKSTFKGGTLTMERNVEDGTWTDVWIFDDLVMGTNRLHVSGGKPLEWHQNLPAVYEDFRPSTYDQAARLADMDAHHQQVGISYPNTFPRFAGQGFAERPDKSLALLCLQIYNDWMIDEWCGGAGRGRLVPLTLIPLWDPEAARRGPALRRQGQPRHRLQREPGQARLLLALHR